MVTGHLAKEGANCFNGTFDGNNIGIGRLRGLLGIALFKVVVLGIIFYILSWSDSSV